MPRLITDNTQLRLFFVNIMKEVPGERALFDKLSAYIDEAERELCHKITGAKVFELLTSAPDSTLTDMARMAVAMRAMCKALRALDLILTPNGFGVVSTQSLAPASKARVDDYAAECSRRRNSALEQLLSVLEDSKVWKKTEQRASFHRTLFAGLNICKIALPPTDDWLEAYEELSAKGREQEDMLADRWFSHELLSRLRLEYAAGLPLSTIEQSVARAIRTIVGAALKGEKPSQRRLSEIVDFIRKRPEDFPLWHASPVAKTFAPPVFENKKEAGGFFFG